MVKEYEGQNFPERYYKHNILSGKGWADKREQKKELARLKRLVNRRMAAIERADERLKHEAHTRLQAVELADVIQNPNRFSMEEQLAAFSRLAYTNISVTGLRRQFKEEQKFAAEVATYYELKFDEIQFGEFMGAARYSGIMGRKGSEEVARMWDVVEERRLNPVRVLENYERYTSKYLTEYTESFFSRK